MGHEMLTDRSVYVTVAIVATVPKVADAVVVGGGTIGAWTAWFLQASGIGDVVLVERDTLGQGASSRAAGMVRAQGGTETAVRLGLFSREFYAGQQDVLGIDSGFVAQGYFMPCFSDDEVAQTHERIAMQQALGLEVRWVGPDEVDASNPAMAPGRTLGASYAPGDGYIDPPRNVLAYTAAVLGAGVRVCERTAFTGLVVEGGHVTGVRTSAGDVATPRVVLTGGPTLAAVGAAAGVRIPTWGTRHQVVVTEAHPDFAAERLPMVFDLASGVYWRPCEGGVLWGMSNPDEAPGEATEFDTGYFEVMRDRMATLVPTTGKVGLRKTWAATIDFTPDHFPIIGPAIGADGPIDGAYVAASGGHGMMWGPGVAKATADLVVSGHTEVVDVTDLGLDRFDEHGRSRLDPDPVTLPFPR
jgi:sarcosine oxidase subunit beta